MGSNGIGMVIASRLDHHIRDDSGSIGIGSGQNRIATELDQLGSDRDRIGSNRIRLASEPDWNRSESGQIAFELDQPRIDTARLGWG